MISKVVGNRIKELRKELNMTQEQLYLRSGLARNYCSEVECGKRNISMESLNKIVAALGVSYVVFFDSPAFQECLDEMDYVTMGLPRE